MEPAVNKATTLSDPSSPDYDYSEIDRNSEQAEAEVQEMIGKRLPLADLTTLDDIKQRIARLHSSN